MALLLCNAALTSKQVYPAALQAKDHHYFSALVSSQKFQGQSPKKNAFAVARRALSETVSRSPQPVKEKDASSAEKHHAERLNLADSWRKIHGEDDWAGLLDPIDPLLRFEIIRYGELTQACYDSFNNDPYSTGCGSCRYGPRDFFEKVGLRGVGHRYEVTHYIYATSNIKLPRFFKLAISKSPNVWSKKANWIGYVAVSNDETSKLLGRRDIVVAWRGTVMGIEWIADLTDFLRPLSSDNIPCPDPSVKVESGFLDLYTDHDENCNYCKFSARLQVLSEIKRLVHKYRDEEMSITVMGHSLGSALATLSAYDIAETNTNIVRPEGRTVPVCVFSFAGPRVGNQRFKERIEELGVKVLRVLNTHDVVPKSPGMILNEKLPSLLLKLTEWTPWTYVHVGKELVLDHEDSPFLKPTSDVSCFHNLEAHLHLVDGYTGKGRKFESATGRDLALVNKSTNFVVDDHGVPPNWMQDENKGLMMNEHGHWVHVKWPSVVEHPIHLPTRVQEFYESFFQ